jgi:hypothetical protein
MARAITFAGANRVGDTVVMVHTVTLKLPVIVSSYEIRMMENEEAFLAQVAHLCAKETLPIIIIGDFNIIKRAT